MALASMVMMCGGCVAERGVVDKGYMELSLLEHLDEEARHRVLIVSKDSIPTHEEIEHYFQVHREYIHNKILWNQPLEVGNGLVWRFTSPELNFVWYSECQYAPVLPIARSGLNLSLEIINLNRHQNEYGKVGGFKLVSINLVRNGETMEIPLTDAGKFIKFDPKESPRSCRLIIPANYKDSEIEWTYRFEILESPGLSNISEMENQNIISELEEEPEVRGLTYSLTFVQAYPNPEPTWGS